MLESVKISASQLSTFKDCPRKWAFDKINKIPRPETQATSAGTAIHAEIEDYYRHGTTPTSKAAQALLQHLPPPGPSIKMEADFVFPWFNEGVIMTGIVDLVDTATDTIYDHKTTSNVRRYAKTVEDLLLDPQPILYGMHYRTAYGPREAVNIQFTYVQREEPLTRPPHTSPVLFQQSLTDLEKGLKVLTPIVDEIVQIRRGGAKCATEVRFDQSACYKFGKCPYKDVCPDYVGKSRHPQPEPLMNPDFFALMKQATEKANQTPIPEPVQEQQQAPTPVATPAPISEPPKMPLLETLAIEFATQTQVVPPDAQPNVSENDPPPPPVVGSKAKKATKAKAAPVVEPVAEPITEVDQPPVIDVVADRPKNLQNLMEQAAIDILLTGTNVEKLEVIRLFRC